MTLNGVHFPMDQIAQVCRKHHAVKLSLFGSILRDDFNAESDIDFLVEFDPAARVSLLTVGGMIFALQQLLGRPVDVVSEGELSPLFRNRVLRSARLLHAA